MKVRIQGNRYRWYRVQWERGENELQTWETEAMVRTLSEAREIKARLEQSASSDFHIWTTIEGPVSDDGQSQKNG